jgi:hypothetical protein
VGDELRGQIPCRHREGVKNGGVEGRSSEEISSPPSSQVLLSPGAEPCGTIAVYRETKRGHCRRTWRVSAFVSLTPLPLLRFMGRTRSTARRVLVSAFSVPRRVHLLSGEAGACYNRVGPSGSAKRRSGGKDRLLPIPRLRTEFSAAPLFIAVDAM